MKKLFFRLVLVALIVAAGWAGYRYFKGLPGRQSQMPTTRVRQGDVVVRSYARGELRAVRTAQLTAPNLFGTVQVTRLAPLGALAKEKDLIVEFDDSELLSRLDSAQLELEQYDEQIKKAKADLAIRNNQDEVDLLRSRYAVRRSELEVKRNELLPVIDQKKNLLNLEEAKRRLTQLESDIKSKREQSEAELNVMIERRRRSLLNIGREKVRLAQVKVLAPISGLVAIKQNRGGFSGTFGQQVPDIREGDQVQPGSPVADVLDLSELEILARVGELDRANLREGQDIMIRLDAVSEKVFNGKIKSMSGTASANLFSSDPGKKFDVLFSIDMRQLLSALGATGDQINRIMATADENRKKPIAVASTSVMTMLGGAMQGSAMPNGVMQGGMPGGMPSGGQAFMVQQPGQDSNQGGQAAAGERGSRGGRGGQGSGLPGGGQMTDAQRKQMTAVMNKLTGGKNLQDLSSEERQKVFTQLRAEMQKITGSQPATAGGQGGRGGENARGEGGRGGRGGRGEGGGDVPMPSGSGQFSQKELDAAKLPPPPGEESQLDVLLRPGLLADVEIIVEKVPNAIYLPNQAIFEKDGKPAVYVRSGSSWVARPIQIAKRSESVTVISGGVTAGETVAMQNPEEKPGDKKRSQKKDGSGGGAGGGGAMGALPTGEAKGGR